mgnify:CR=1 FL=1
MASDDPLKTLSEALPQNPTERTTKPTKPIRSLRDAINKHCKSCIYDEKAVGSGTWRQQVGACPVVSCELHGVRPLPQGMNTNNALMRPYRDRSVISAFVSNFSMVLKHCVCSRSAREYRGCALSALRLAA